jgi:hypothetical protein
LSPDPRRLLTFHAGGQAFSAEFTRPVPCQVPALAAAFLPTIGGHGHARVDDFNVPRLVRFKSAHTHTSGSFLDVKTATAHVSTTIEGLNILDMITADRITGRLTSEHKVGEPEGHILAIGSGFENLRIGGYEFKINLRHELLLDNKTHAQLVKKVASDKKSRKMATTEGRVTVCSLVEEIETDFPGLSADDKKCHVVEIPHFGTISFAELICHEGTKTLTMLRFDLGSPDAGKGTAGEVAMNGPQYPPPHK